MRELRPLFGPPDPADRLEYRPGELAQCDLWYVPVPVPIGAGGARVLPVLAMTCGYPRGPVMISVVRHEALLVRVEVRDLRRLAVVAVG